MNLADKLTASRIVMAPIFFILYFVSETFGASSIGLVSIVGLWALFIVMELTDLLDGMAARKLGIVSPFGKLFDPFADVLARLAYFICFAFSGIMPLWVFLIVIFREYSISFLRMLLTQQGIAMGARKGGKTKAVVYMISGGFSLILVTLRRLSLFPEFDAPLFWFVFGLYVLSAVLSLVSFADYMIQFRILTKPKA